MLYEVITHQSEYEPDTGKNHHRIGVAHGRGVLMLASVVIGPVILIIFLEKRMLIAPRLARVFSARSYNFV